jgi:hypothetical protein
MMRIGRDGQASCAMADTAAMVETTAAANVILAAKKIMLSLPLDPAVGAPLIFITANAGGRVRSSAVFSRSPAG